MIFVFITLVALVELLALALAVSLVLLAAKVALAVLRARQLEREQQAAPCRRVIDGGKRHDLRSQARRTPTTRVRPVGGARRDGC